MENNAPKSQSKKSQVFALFFILATVSIASVGIISNASKNEKENAERRIKLEFQEKQAESIKIKRNDSLSKIAWGDAKFGMSIKEAKKTNTFKGIREKLVFTDYKTLTISYPQTKIDGINEIEASFFKDRLGYIHMYSRYYTAHYFDSELLDISDNLSKLIKEKYGDPNDKMQYPKITELRPGKGVKIFEWQIGKKNIRCDQCNR